MVLPVLKIAIAETALVISILDTHPPLQGLEKLKFQKKVFDASVQSCHLSSEASIFVELAACVSPTEGDLSPKTMLQYPRLQRRAVWMNMPHMAAHPP